jgi:hypothetical protein
MLLLPSTAPDTGLVFMDDVLGRLKEPLVKIIIHLDNVMYLDARRPHNDLGLISDGNGVRKQPPDRFSLDKQKSFRA